MNIIAAKTNYKQISLVDVHGSYQIFTYYPNKDRVHRFRGNTRVTQFMTKEEADREVYALTISGWKIDRATGMAQGWRPAASVEA